MNKKDAEGFYQLPTIRGLSECLKAYIEITKREEEITAMAEQNKKVLGKILEDKKDGRL